MATVFVSPDFPFVLFFFIDSVFKVIVRISCLYFNM